MSTETEIKISVSSIENFIEKLRGHNPRVVADRHFEDNRLLDFPDKRLQNAGCIVRIRYAGERSFLTYKGPPEAEGIFKSREELETKLEAILRFRYWRSSGCVCGSVIRNIVVNTK